jgi:serine phosphatase RsbU (regulator of sigma subunit)
VSGDFYWFSVNRNRVYFAAVDCTGHGVPGAFMSMLGFTMLNQIVSTNEDLTAAEILNRLREDVKEALHQKGTMNEPHDGMDLALCVLDTEEFSLQFSGARNPLYLIRHGELIQYSGDLMPIGHAGKLESRPFTNHLIQLQKDDMVYVFSDGYTDQFGGESGQKFKRSLFKKTLLSIHEEPLDVQERLLKETLDTWKLNYEQVDDILVLGIRF